MALNVWEGVKTTSLKTRLLESYYPRVEIQVAENQSRSEEMTTVLRGLERALKKATFECPLLGSQFPVVEYFSFVKPIMDVLNAATSPQEAVQSFIAAAQERIRELTLPETAANAAGTLLEDFDEVLIKYGRIDTGLYFLIHEAGRKPNGKWVLKFLLHRAGPQERSIKVDEGPRPAFRCGQPNGLHCVEWVEWPASVMGIERDDRNYPVYVQSHALDNLYRKEARALFIENGEWIVHDYLWQSLRKPKLLPMPRESNKFLIEYNLNIHKLGYLVASRREDVVVVESFLFLTMNGTPEGDALWKKLGLSKADKQYLGLDLIQTFLMTDLQFDPELVSILEDCGCGHLFRVLKELPRERYIPGYAQDVRKYLRLEE
jgi:hypothetical protein